jgi:adenosylcobinamide kinase / adenosylcobinamide-phosphate guanylyltransferase
VAYIATARPEDAGMQSRIARHREDRPAAWTTLEEPLSVAAAIRRAEAGFVIVDCLTVWLSNFCWEYRDRTPGELETLACAEIEGAAFAAGARQLILVSNEVGGGIVPENPVGRLFRDLQGLVNQRAAELADRVFLTVAGIPVGIKPRECAS